MTDHSPDTTLDTITARLRTFVIVAAILVGIGECLAFGLYALLNPTFLILGAVFSNKDPKKGRWLMWVGALILTLWTIPFYAALFDKTTFGPGSSPARMLFPAVAALMTAIDLALIRDALTTSRGQPCSPRHE